MSFELLFASSVLPAKNATRIHEPPPDAGLIAAYNTILIFGLVSLAAIGITAYFSSRVQRSSTWYSFVIWWFFYAASYLILGGQQLGPPPNPGVCLFQSALVYATPPLTAYASVALLLQLRMSVSGLMSSQGLGIDRRRLFALHLIPVIMFLVVFVTVIVHGSMVPNQVRRDRSGMYCNITSGLPTKISAALVIFAMLMILVLEVSTVMLLHRNWTAFRSFGSRDPGVSLAMIVRVSCFSFLPMIALAVTIVFTFAVLTPRGGAISNLVPASLPGIAGTIFATQEDNLRVWTWWRKDSPPTPPKTQDRPIDPIKVHVSVVTSNRDKPLPPVLDISYPRSPSQLGSHFSMA